MITYLLSGLLAGLIIGAIAAWIIRGLKIEKNSISAGQYNAALDELEGLKKQAAILEFVRAAKEEIEGRLHKKEEELQQANTMKATAEAGMTNISKRNGELQEELAGIKVSRDETTSNLAEAERKIARLEESLKLKQDKLDTQEKDLEQMKQMMATEFKVLANDILETKAKAFGEQQESKLTEMLTPFRKEIEAFKKDFDEKFTDEVREKSSLRTEISKLATLNNTLAHEAKSLTDALRGSTKKQGDWGEDILERILEFSGLQKNVHYVLQAQSQNDEGQTIRPDVIVNYPDNRFLVIDSKVSLSNYWDFCNASELTEQESHLPLLIRSIKTHIDALRSKKYSDVAGTPDFIIMFMPVEAAYMTAMQADHSLWQYAYDRKVLMISPTNLIPAMKMVSDMWSRDSISKDAEMIAERSVKLYEKLVGFIDSFEGVGKELDQANKKWQEARGRLYEGSGNIVSQGKRLKTMLGNKTNKEIEEKLVQLAEAEENIATSNVPLTEG